VEVVPSEWTRQDLVQRAIQFLQQVGMQPIQVKKEIDGFVLNRLQYALLAEAYRLVEVCRIYSRKEPQVAVNPSIS
jgi:L-gulonate 3-dehydrogenase